MAGKYNLPNPDEADVDNDGFVTELDAYKLQKFLLGYSVTIKPDDTSGSSTSLLNTTMNYRRYSASTGSLIETYTVNAAENLPNSTGRSIIGIDERYRDYSHSGICKIETTTGTGTGFVASDNTILTAGHVVNGSRIISIEFFDSNGNVTLTPTALNYSIPTNYLFYDNADYALIVVNNDLSDYNNFGLGFALNRAINEEADVSVTGFSKNKSNNLIYESTGIGKLKNSTNGNNELKYDCDTDHGTSGGPIYSKLFYEGEYYYIVVGIHTDGTGDIYAYNSGVRMCPNILNLIRAN